MTARHAIVAVVVAALLISAPLMAPPYVMHLIIQILLWGFVYTAWSIMGRFGLVSLGHGAFIDRKSVV